MPAETDNEKQPPSAESIEEEKPHVQQDDDDVIVSIGTTKAQRKSVANKQASPSTDLSGDNDDDKTRRKGAGRLSVSSASSRVGASKSRPAKEDTKNNRVGRESESESPTKRNEHTPATMPLRREGNLTPHTHLVPGAMTVHGTSSSPPLDDENEDAFSDDGSDNERLIHIQNPIAAQAVDESQEFRQAEELAALRAYREEQERRLQANVESTPAEELPTPIRAVVVQVDDNDKDTSSTRKNWLLIGGIFCFVLTGAGVGAGVGLGLGGGGGDDNGSPVLPELQSPVPSEMPFTSFAPSTSAVVPTFVRRPSVAPTTSTLSPTASLSPSETPSIRCFTERDELLSAINDYIVDSSVDSEVARNFGHPIGTWCFHNITNFGRLFFQQGSFNEDISAWNTSGVKSMRGMFDRAFVFNQSLNAWDMSGVEDVSFMFSGARSFNGDISMWNLSSATTVARMFRSSSSFNRDISGWMLAL